MNEVTKHGANINSGGQGVGRRRSKTGFVVAAACFLLAGILASVLGQSPAEVSNVEYVVEQDGTVVLRYDLLGTGNASEAFRISVLVSTDGGTSYSVTPRLVSGDVGPGVRAGVRKRIEWNVRDDVKRLQGDSVVFRVNADLESPPDFVDPPELREAPSVFELRHRHSDFFKVNNSMHAVRFEVRSRTIAFDPQVPGNYAPPEATFAGPPCTFVPFAMALAVVSAEIVTVGQERFVKLEIAQAGDGTKSSTLHLGVGRWSGPGDQLQALLARISTAKQQLAPRSEGTPGTTAAELVQRAAVALGGIDRLQTIRDYVYTVALRRFDRSDYPKTGFGSFEGAGAGRFRREVSFDGQTQLVVGDGKKVWQQDAGKGLKRADDGQARYLTLAASHFDGLRLVEWGKEAKLAGQLTVRGKVAWRLERTLSSDARVWADIDAVTGLPVRYGLVAKGLPLVEVELFDYVQYGGVREARRRVEYVNGVLAAEVLIRSVQFNTGIPPQRFELSR